MKCRPVIILAVLTLLPLPAATAAAGGTAGAATAPGHRANAPAGSHVQPGGTEIPAPGVVSRPGRPALSVTSGNWSGLAVHGNAGSLTSVSNGWTEPTATCSSGSQYASFWVGLDGYQQHNNTVEQTGTYANCINSIPVYQAWYEMYPNAPVNFPNPVSPGDNITGSVAYNGGGNFTLTLADAQKGWTNTVHQHLAGTQLSSAEAIAEAPTVNGSTAPLADFGGISFGITVVNGRKFTSYPYDTITMVDGQGLAKDIVYLTELGTLDVFWKRST